jgi:hypothetical protein
VQERPTLTSSDSINADAVDILNVQVDKETTTTTTTTDKAIDVQSGDSSQVVLDKDHHIMTSRELGKLFDKAANQIKFVNNSTTTNAVIDIVVPRKATS